MLNYSNIDLIRLASLLLPLLTTFSTNALAGRLIFIISVVGLSFSSVTSPAVALLVSTIAVIISKNSQKFLALFAISLIAVSGSWLNPGLIEFILISIGYIVFALKEKSSIFLLPIFTILFLLLCLDATNLNPSSGFTMALMTVIPMVIICLFSQRSIVENNPLVILGLVFTWLMKQYVDQNISSLTLVQSDTWNLFNLSCLVYLLLNFLLKTHKYKSYKQDLIKTLVLASYLGTASGQLLSLSSNYIFSIMIVGIAGLLLNQMNFLHKRDKVLGLAIGLTAILLEASIIFSYELNLPYLSISIFFVASQLYYLIKMVDFGDKAVNPYIYRERLPQFVFILVTFGWYASLWYILYYVRQIQG